MVCLWLQFAATTVTIVSGAVAERTKFEAYLLYAFSLTSWVYPVIVHWVWDPTGWLSAFNEDDLFNGTHPVSTVFLHWNGNLTKSPQPGSRRVFFFGGKCAIVNTE